MGGVLDFLFEGTPPKSVTTYGETIENIPKWMSDYTQGMIAKANAAAAEPYMAFEGPRIAGFTPEQEAGFKLGEENVGTYKPFLDEARTGAGAAAAGTGTGLGFLQQAGESTFPGAVDQYMNPYIQNVLDRQESMAGRTLKEKFLPQLQRTFAGAGQYGSRGGAGSMGAAGIQGLRDITENLEEQRLATLGQAYGQAADIYGADVGRQAEVGATMGQLGVQGAQQMGALGEAAQTMGLKDAATMSAIGAEKQQMGQASLDLAQRDFQEQKDLPFDRLQFMQSMLQGTPYSTQTQRTDVGPADIYQPSGLAQIAGAYGTYKGLEGEFSARGGRIRGRRYYKGGLARVIDLDPSEWEVVSHG